MFKKIKIIVRRIIVWLCCRRIRFEDNKTQIFYQLWQESLVRDDKRYNDFIKEYFS